VWLDVAALGDGEVACIGLPGVVGDDDGVVGSAFEERWAGENADDVLGGVAVLAAAGDAFKGVVLLDAAAATAAAIAATPLGGVVVVVGFEACGVAGC
jgi:hypothetical protein